MIQKNLISFFTTLVIASTSINAATEDKVYATVNGNNITASDISIALQNQQISFDALPKAQQKQLLEQLVQKSILANMAMKSDVIKEKTYIDTLNATISNLKEELALQMWMQKLSKEITVKDNLITKYYKQNKEKFLKPLELKASHILVKTKKEANDIINSLKNSKLLKSDFTALAKEKSTGPSGKSGGELGWFTKDKMVAEFSKAASALGVNKISLEPVKTQFGYHVIYLDDKKEKASVKFNEVKNQIKMMLSSEKFKLKLDEILKEQISKSKITYK